MIGCASPSAPTSGRRSPTPSGATWSTGATTWSWSARAFRGPTSAGRSARRWHRTQAERGVVCCWTGTGVSMAANKVAGVRAALCTDAETAKGARRWNDANVLAMGLRLTSPELATEMIDAFLATEADPGERAEIAKLVLMTDLKLTEWTSCGGCAAKWGGAPLAGLLRSVRSAAAGGLPEGLLVGLAPFDDAAVYRLSDDLALVSTTDFFPPLVDDPADFGADRRGQRLQRRVRHGRPGRARPQHLRLPRARCPPRPSPPSSTPAAAVVDEAGGVVAGGHTIRTEEPIFGLAVQGIVHPDRILTKGGARPGDVLVLSKPIGTGIVLAGGDERRQGRRHRRDATAQPGGVRGARRAGRRRPRRHRRHRLRAARPRVGDGRALRRPAQLRHSARCRCTTAPWPRPRPACAPAATPATGPTSGRVTSTSGAAPALEALAYRPADVGRAARRGRSGRGRAT